MLKKTISILLTLCILLAVFTVIQLSVAAADIDTAATGLTDEAYPAYTYELVDNHAEITKYKDTETNVTIPAKLGGYPVTRIRYNAFRMCKELVSISIGGSVTHIDSRAFVECSSLTNIHIGKSVTHIYRNSFYDCSMLTSFTGCESLTHICGDDFGYLKDTIWFENQPDGVVYIGNVAFCIKGECPAELIFRQGTTGIADNAFSYQNDLIKVTIPSSVTRIGSAAFKSCENLESVDMPDSAVSVGSSAFDNTALVSSPYNHEKMYYVGNIAYHLFSNMYHPVNTIDIKPGTTSIADSAMVTSSFSKITIPDSVVLIGDQAIYGNRNLENIVIPASVKSIGDKALGYYSTGSGDANVRHVEGFTIYGYTNSEAERYAAENGFTFVSVGTVPIEPSYLLGDADGDGDITSIDVTIIQRVIAQLQTNIDEVTLMQGDADGNGFLEIIDATFIQRYLASMETPFPIGEAA